MASVPSHCSHRPRQKRRHRLRGGVKAGVHQRPASALVRRRRALQDHHCQLLTPSSTAASGMAVSRALLMIFLRAHCASLRCILMPPCRCNDDDPVWKQKANYSQLGGATLHAPSLMKVLPPRASACSRYRWYHLQRATPELRGRRHLVDSACASIRVNSGQLEIVGFIRIDQAAHANHQVHQVVAIKNEQRRHRDHWGARICDETDAHKFDSVRTPLGRERCVMCFCDSCG